MSAIEKNIVAQAKRSGDPIPNRIKNKPKLEAGLDLFFHAFYELSTERLGGMGPMPIPWSAIHNYCVANDITGELREDMLHFVRAMDCAYLEHVMEKQK